MLQTFHHAKIKIWKHISPFFKFPKNNNKKSFCLPICIELSIPMSLPFSKTKSDPKLDEMYLRKIAVVIFGFRNLHFLPIFG